MSVFLGELDDGYLSGLGFDGTETLVRDRREWQRRIWSGAAKGGINYAFNAGEIDLSRPYGLRRTRLVPFLAMNKARGGRAVHVGLGLR